MTLHKLALLAIAPVLFACAPHDPIADEFKKTIAKCERNIDQYQKYVGQKIGEVDFPEDLPTKLYQEGFAATMEASPGRVVISADKNGVIKNVSCEQE